MGMILKLYGRRILAAVLVTVFCHSGGFQQQAFADSAPMDCGDFWPSSDGIPDVTTGGAFACREYDPRDPTLVVGPGTNYRIFYTAEWDRYPRPESEAFLEAVARGFSDSVLHYRMLGLRVDPIYFMVTESLGLEDLDDPLSPPDAGLAAEAFRDWIDINEPCPVTSFSVAFAEAAAVGMDWVKHLTAHEVFHCVQATVFEEQDAATGADWWAEGTAEYFANAVYPCGNYEHGFASRYNPDLRIFAQKYTNVALFQDFAERSIGEPGILDFIRNMTTRDGGAAQQQATSGYGGMSDLFHRFGKDFIDDAVPDCGGRMAVNSSGGAVEEIGDNGSITIEASPFTIWRKRVKLLMGRIYTIEKETISGDGRLSSRDIESPGEWAGMPTRITTSCDEDTVLQLAATTTPPGNTPFRQTLNFSSIDDHETEDCQACVDTGKRDACIVGSWSASSADIENWLRRVLTSSNTATTTTEVTGFAGSASISAVSAGGRMTGVVDGVEIDGRITRRTPRGTYIDLFKFEGGGETQSTWSTDSSRSRLYVCTEESTIAFTMTISNEDGSVTVPIPIPNGDGSAAEFEYTCSETSLVVTHKSPGLPDQVYRAHRLR